MPEELKESDLWTPGEIWRCKKLRFRTMMFQELNSLDATLAHRYWALAGYQAELLRANIMQSILIHRPRMHWSVSEAIRIEADKLGANCF